MVLEAVSGINSQTLSVRSLVRHPPRPGLERFAERLLGCGFSREEAAALCEACNVCAPRGRLRGLGLAVLQLSKVFPADVELRNDWLPAVRQWFVRDPDAHRSFGLQPYATNAPVTAFLACVAKRLPAELSRAIFVRMLDLLADHAEAERSCYVLHLSAKHLADQRDTNPMVAKLIAAHDWPGAIAAMRPPNVNRPGVLESYEAALRNSIGRRKPATYRSGRLDCHSGTVSVSHSCDVPAKPIVSLRERIARVSQSASTNQPEVDDEEPAEDADLPGDDPSTSGVRRSSGLQNNIALGVARDLNDLDPLKMHRLLVRLATSDLDRSEQWVFRVSLTTMYCTGWPAGVLTALAEGETARYESASGAVLMPGTLISPWPEIASRTFHILLHPQLVRLFDSLVHSGLFRLPDGEPITSAHVSAALRVLCAEDSVRVTQAMLRGAVWRVGRDKGWTPERLIICTCKSDPGFRNDVHYLLFGDELDARPLHELMLASLTEAERRWHKLERSGVPAVR